MLWVDLLYVLMSIFVLFVHLKRILIYKLVQVTEWPRLSIHHFSETAFFQNLTFLKHPKAQKGFFHVKMSARQVTTFLEKYKLTIYPLKCTKPKQN